jgi:hypothetical protein
MFSRRWRPYCASADFRIRRRCRRKLYLEDPRRKGVRTSPRFVTRTFRPAGMPNHLATGRQRAEEESEELSYCDVSAVGARAWEWRAFRATSKGVVVGIVFRAIVHHGDVGVVAARLRLKRGRHHPPTHAHHERQHRHRSESHRRTSPVTVRTGRHTTPQDNAGQALEQLRGRSRRCGCAPQ